MRNNIKEGKTQWSLNSAITYPGFKEHKEKHEEFKRTVDALHEFLEESEGPTAAFVDQVKQQVVDWLFRHIEGFDRSVAEYINYVNNPGRL